MIYLFLFVFKNEVNMFILKHFKILKYELFIITKFLKYLKTKEKT